MTYTKFDLGKQHVSLPVARKPMTRGGRYLAQRHRVHPSIADTLARLADLGQTPEVR